MLNKILALDKKKKIIIASVLGAIVFISAVSCIAAFSRHNSGVEVQEPESSYDAAAENESVDASNELNTSDTSSDTANTDETSTDAQTQGSPISSSQSPDAPTANQVIKQTQPVISSAAPSQSGTPLQMHGRLSVKGTEIVDKNGNPYKLNGISTHGINHFPKYVDKEGFRTLRDSWGVNLMRIAVYSMEYNGYCNGGNKAEQKAIVDNAVKYCAELGMYVIIDWHILSDYDPNMHITEAKEFFSDVSAKYSGYENVIYEICNEPNKDENENIVPWKDIKKYADEVIPVIRNNDKNAIIIVGTPNYSQDVDEAAKDPIKGQTNIAYALHFYASTHNKWLIDKAKTALRKGLPIFVSEYNICDASGDGAIDYESAKEWMNFIKKNNLPCAAWSLSNKGETASLIKEGCTKTYGWSDGDLSDTAKWIKKQYTS